MSYQYHIESYQNGVATKAVMQKANLFYRRGNSVFYCYIKYFSNHGNFVVVSLLFNVILNSQSLLKYDINLVKNELNEFSSKNLIAVTQLAHFPRFYDTYYNEIVHMYSILRR